MKRLLFGMTIALLLTGSQVRADNIDAGLLEAGRADKIMKHLRDRNYKNVAVLRFEVKKGSAASTLSAGQLNALMATRLENALIQLVKSSDPIGITRGASATVAAKERHVNLHTASGRQNLFKHDYALAWDNRTVKVDAYLTGRVETSQDFKTARVVIQCCDKKDLTIKEILAFTVKTDRSTLRDMGQSFVISRSALSLRPRAAQITDEELDSDAIKDVAKDNKKPDNSDPDNPDPTKPPPGSNNYVQMKEYLEYTIMVDGTAAALTPHGADAKIDTPNPGQKVTVKLKAKVKLGLVLRVNGVNTAKDERDSRPVKDMTWWVLEPNQEYTIRGFYDNGRLKPFQMVANAEKADLSDREESHGKFELDVFAVKDVTQGTDPKIQANPAAANSGLRQAVPRSGKLSTVQQALKQQLTSTKAKGTSTALSAFIVGRGDEQATLETTTLTGAVHVGSCGIFYKLTKDGGNP
jgi:hypothetical protein